MIEKINNILLVEDERGHAELIRRSFKTASVPVSLTVARNLHEARSSIVKSTPDLIIADFRLPDGKGIDIIPDKEEDSPYPVIILTSQGDEQVAVETMKAGAFDYIVKSEVTMDNMPRLYKRIMREWSHVTERKKAEEQIRKLSHAVEYSHATIFITDTEGSIEYANPGFTQLTGYSIEETIGRNSRFLQSGVTSSEVHKELWETIVSGNEWRGEFCNKKKNGEVYWESASISPVKDDKGVITHFIAIKEEITRRKKAEEESRSSKLLLEAFVENSPSVIFIKDLDGRLIRINRAFEDLLVIGREDLLGKTDYDLYPTSKSTAERMRANDRMVLEAGKPLAIEEVPKVNGEDRFYITVKFPIRDERGEITSIAGIATDITERKKMEMELRHNEERFRSLIESTTSIIWTTDVSGEFVAPQPSWEKYTGQPWSEHKGIGWTKKIHPDDIEHLLKVWKKATQEISLYETWGRIWNANLKEWRDFEVRAVPIMNHDGSLREWVGIITDITERKKAENLVREKEQQIRLFMLSTNDSVWNWNMVAGTVERSIGFERAFGYAVDDIDSGIEWWVDRLHPDDKERVLQSFNDAVAGGKEFCGYEYRFRCSDGSYANIEDSVCIIREDTGKAVRSLGAMRNITERKKAEKELRQYGHIVSCSTDIMALLNKSFIYLAVNQAYLEAFKKTRKEVIGHTTSEVLGEEFFNTVIKSNAESVLAGEEVNYQAWFNFPAHERRYMDITYYPYFDENKKVVGFVLNGRDITERKKAEEALEKSEQHYHSIFDNAMDGIGLCTPEGKLVTPNNAFAEITGYSIKELLGMSYQELTPPEYHEMEAEKMKILLETGIPQEYEKEYIRKDGTRIPLLFNVSAICGVNGKPVLFLAILKNMTNIKKAEKMLQEQKEILVQKNIALNEILGQIEIEKKQIKDNVIANAEHLLLPVIQKLRLTGESIELVKLLQKNLLELTSSFGTKLTKKGVKLTTREIEFCNMIKNGLTNKEIASLSNISLATIERHRANIRKKLGLINKDVNLSSFLKTL